MYEKMNPLEIKYYCFLKNDIYMLLVHHTKILLFFYKISKNRKYGILLRKLLLFYRELLFNKLNVKDVYDEILNSIYIKLMNIIKSNNLCILIKNLKTRNIRGFDFFNASALFKNGESFLAVNTGVFFLSHTLVKSIGILLMKNISGEKLPFPIIFSDKFLMKEFIKTTSAIICENHSKARYKMGIIINDDHPLLFGIELFCVAHEYSHLLFKNINNDYSLLNMDKYYNSNLIGLIYSNEEIAADAFAIIIMRHYIEFDDYMDWFLYSPQFLFKILSNCDEITLYPQSKTHPLDIDRYNYIKEMININKYNIYDNEINIIWKKCKKRVNNIFKKYKNNNKIYFPILEEIFNLI